jgi:serine protease Do
MTAIRYCASRIFYTAIAIVVFAIATPQAAFARSAPDSFADQVEQLMPAVVNISTTQKIKTGGAMGFGGMQDPLMDEQLRDLFEKLLPPGAMQGMPGQPAPQEREAQSLGSGFIIDPDGYVVTNNHVIEGASEIHVILSNDTKLDAEVIGHDPKTDVALLKVKSDKKLPFVKFGDSDKSRVGDWVIAIGNPFGLGGTVTAGIISARARNINAGPFDDFIQTDASINRGNSGGPLFNLEGEVIGINTAIFSPSGGSIGIGFAAPSALAKPIIEQLKEHGRTFRGWLGVKIQMVTDEVAESLGMGRTYGALVAEVTPDGPAEKSGLKAGDVIIEFGGREVEEMRFLPRMVAETEIGKKVSVIVLRDGKRREIDVKLGELKEEQTTVATAEEEQKIETPNTETYATHGMNLAEIDDALRQRFGLKPDTKGIMVVTLESGSEAARQGIVFGDVIQRVNDMPVTNLSSFKKAMESVRKAGRKHALLRIWREDTTVFITIPSEAKKKE